MFLNIWESIREEFVRLFSASSFKAILILLAGFMIGVVFMLVFYGIYVLASIKKTQKKISKEFEYSEEDEVKREKALQVIEARKAEFDEWSKDLNVGEKFRELENMLRDLTTSIAKVYYPESKYPYAELSIDELLEVDRRINEKIDRIFKQKKFKFFRNKKISTVLSLIDKGKKVKNKKIIKAAQKMKVQSIQKTVMSALNVVNPLYYFKKGAYKYIVDYGTNTFIKSLIDIVGGETAEIYSKNKVRIEMEDYDEEEIYDTTSD